MSVMTTVLGGATVPVVRRPRRARRPATLVPAPVATAPAVTVPAAPVVRPAMTVTDPIVERMVTPQWRLSAPSAAERAWGVVAHLSGMFASAAGPMLVARLAGRRSDYVRQQATAAANFQLTFLAALAPLALIGVLAVGLAALFVVPLVLAWLLTTVLAATAAADGERYRYPVLLPIVR